MSDIAVTSLSGMRMLSEMPSYYEDIRETRALVQTEGVELDDLLVAINIVLNQHFVETATSQLLNWEYEFGIKSPAGQPADQRRSVLRSKIRGVGTVTADLVERVAEAYVNGEVEVTENNSNYTVMITFVSTLGVPPNMADIQAAIRDILPAHLAVNFVFRFYLYSELIASGMTYAQLAATGITYDQLYNGGL